MIVVDFLAQSSRYVPADGLQCPKCSNTMRMMSGLDWSSNNSCWYFFLFLSLTLLRHNVSLLLPSNHVFTPWMGQQMSNSISWPVSASYTVISDRSTTSIYLCLGCTWWFNCSSFCNSNFMSYSCVPTLTLLQTYGLAHGSHRHLCHGHIHTFPMICWKAMSMRR